MVLVDTACWMGMLRSVVSVALLGAATEEGREDSDSGMRLQPSNQIV